MSEQPYDDLSIEDLIRAVSVQLRQSQDDRLASGEPAIFEVSELTLDISFTVTRSEKVGGGFDLKVLRADGGVQHDHQSVQRVSLTLSAVKDQPQPFGGFGPLRPRKDQEPSDPADAGR